MAALGEALRGRHAVLLYSVQGGQGTAVTPATAAGVCSYDVTVDSAPQEIYTIGQTGPLKIKPGQSIVNWSISIEAVQSITLLNQAARTAGLLPWLTLGFGVDPDTGASHAWQVQDCKVGRMEISAAPGEIVKCTLSGIGGLIADLTSLSAAHLSPTPLSGYDVVMTTGSGAYEGTSWSVAVDNDLKAHYVLHGVAASTFKRGWSYLTEGKTAISGEIGRFTKSGIDLQAAAPADQTLTVTILDIGGTNSLTATLTGVQFGSDTRRAPIDGEVTHTIPYVATAMTIT